MKLTSEIDPLSEFEPNESWPLMDLFRAEEEFEDLPGHPVDLVDRKNRERGSD